MSAPVRASRSSAVRRRSRRRGGELRLGVPERRGLGHRVARSGVRREDLLLRGGRALRRRRAVSRAVVKCTLTVFVVPAVTAQGPLPPGPPTERQLEAKDEDALFRAARQQLVGGGLPDPRALLRVAGARRLRRGTSVMEAVAGARAAGDGAAEGVCRWQHRPEPRQSNGWGRAERLQRYPARSSRPTISRRSAGCSSIATRSARTSTRTPRTSTPLGIGSSRSSTSTPRTRRRR